jgi:hypothetical protein
MKEIIISRKIWKSSHYFEGTPKIPTKCQQFENSWEKLNKDIKIISKNSYIGNQKYKFKNPVIFSLEELIKWKNQWAWNFHDRRFLNTQRKTKQKKNEESLGNILDSIKRTKISFIGNSRGITDIQRGTMIIQRSNSGETKVVDSR